MRNGTRLATFVFFGSLLGMLAVACRTPEPEPPSQSDLAAAGLDNRGTGLPLVNDPPAPLPPEWRVISGVLRVDIPPGYRELLGPGGFPDVVMSLACDPVGRVWVGTSSGRVYRLGDDDVPTLIATFPRCRVNALAPVAHDRVWAATADGLRLVAQDIRGKWRVTAYRQFWEGGPVWASSVYFPNDYSDRVFGEVADVVAWRGDVVVRGADGAVWHYDGVESVIAVSSAYGLLQPNGYGGWRTYDAVRGVESVDVDALMPHRRPQCGVRDVDGNVWFGTRHDGVVRVAQANDSGRVAWGKTPGRSRLFTPDEIGKGVTCVSKIAPSTKRERVWAVVDGDDGASLARYDAGRWELRGPTCRPERNIVSPWPVTLTSVLEVAPDRVWIASSDGIYEYTWTSDRTGWLRGVEGAFFTLLKHPSGRIYAGGSDLLVYTQPQGK